MKLVTMNTVDRGSWLIKASILNNKIMIVMYNKRTTDTSVNFFKDELRANLYVEYKVMSEES